MRSPEFSGVAYATHAGSSARNRSAGLADRERRLPWGPGVRTQVGSVSKQFVAVTALLLGRDGDVELDRALADCWPELVGRWRGMTLRQLLTHTAGVPHWHDSGGYRIQQSLEPGERVDRLVDIELPTEPGTEWAYSSPGYLIAAAVIERMAGSAYGELVDRLVLQPLRLVDTRSGQPLEDGAARGYDGDSPAPLLDLHLMPGTGDITSTAADIATFLRAVNSGELIDVGAGSDYATAVPLPADDAATSGPVRKQAYAAGHFVGTVNGRDATICPGDNPGFKALACWLPDDDSCLVALSNDEQHDVDRAAADLLVQD